MGRKKNTAAAEGKVSIGKKFAWSSRGLSMAINGVLVAYITYYCTDVIGLSAGVVGALLLASKLFDGVTDIVAGLIIDRTHSRWGKARPYQAFILPLWLLTIFLFFVPEIGTVGKCVYVFCMYTLVNSVCATFLYGSDALALARCFGSQKERVSVTSFNGVIVMVGCILFSIAMPQLIVYMGTDKLRWLFVITVFAAVFGITGMARFVFCEEVVTDENKDGAAGNTVPIGESIRALFANKYILMLTVILLLYNLMNSLGSSVGTYYYKYIVGNVGLASIVGMASFITPIAIIIFPLITGKTGLVGYLRGGFALAAAGFLIRIIGGTSLITLMIGSVATLVGTVSISGYVNLYIVDCMTYGEWKTGKKIDGLVSSITSFGSKIGTALASGIVGIVMGAAGYDGSMEVQSASANAAIHFCFNY